MASRTVVALLLLLFAVCALGRPTFRGVPIGPCIPGSATHYADAYMFDPAKGGTCGLNPIKYSLQGSAVAVADNLYYVAGTAQNCGQCYEVYAANGARNIIVADVGSAGGTQLNLLSSGNDVWEDITNGGGFGNVGVTYRRISCPVKDDRFGQPYVEGNIVGKWQTTGANAYYWEVHFWNHRLGINRMTVVSGGNTYEIPRKVAAQNAFVWQDNGSITIPFTMTIYSEDGQSLTKVIGTAGQTMGDIAGNGNEFDFGSQFEEPTSNPHANDDDCRPPALPSTIYDDGFPAGPPNIWMSISEYRATPNLAYTTGCYGGSAKCIQIQYQADGGLILGTVFNFMKSDYSGLQFQVKANQVGTAKVSVSGKANTTMTFNVGTSWSQITMNFDDYPSIPDFVEPAYVYFYGSNQVLYIDDIHWVGGDNFAHYFPTAEVFTQKSGGGAASALRPLSLYESVFA